MRIRRYGKLFLILCMVAFVDVCGITRILFLASLNDLNIESVQSELFRSHVLDEEFLGFIQKSGKPALYSGLYFLEKGAVHGKKPKPYNEEHFKKLEKKWRKSSFYKEYISLCEAIWSDVVYFPVPLSTARPSLNVSYVDSWMYTRTYGGKRGHEGTDIMASENKRGLYPVVSMTDGKIVNKGWLPKGGWRLGIQSEHGGYFYYAHLDSYADVEVGDQVKAGDIIGFMGDSGYGEEGTVGMFPVHLHLGIYIYPDGKETSINPYWILQYLENSKLKSSYF
ncbi:M23 family metallopeptidase [Lachnoclostridium sp. An181]|uniref:M23 family metallopeptidase n=1 Tax=Lachnoclostridium sp. An181 TaxID=1965575 RepID=UPI001FA8E1DC|nr:M23 family metallopeptidase [Lachnoclostridium sp. An181]